MDSSDDMLMKMCRMLERTHHEIKTLKEIIGKKENRIKELHGHIKQIETQTTESSEELKQLRGQLDLITNNLTIAAAAQASPHL